MWSASHASHQRPWPLMQQVLGAVAPQASVWQSPHSTQSDNNMVIEGLGARYTPSLPRFVPGTGQDAVYGLCGAQTMKSRGAVSCGHALGL